MSTQRVVVLRCHSLYAELVANLLRAETSAEIIERAGDSDALIAQVGQLNPDIIVVDNQDSGLELDKLLPSLLDDCPNARGICLIMGEPCTSICPARCRRVNTKDELIGAIETVHDQSLGDQAPRDAQPVSFMNSSLAELLFALAIRNGGADKPFDECAEEEGG
jgi:chemotaxis response regulator CheB